MQNVSSNTNLAHQSSAREVQNLIAPATKEQLQAVIDILSQQDQPTSLAEFENLLSAVRDRLLKISDQLSEEQQTVTQISIANVESARSHPSDTVRCAETIRLNSSIFNSLAAAMSPEIIKISDVVEEWSKYQAQTNPSYIKKAINRLVQNGVLEYVGDEHIRRTQIKIKLKGEKEPQQTRTMPSAKTEPLTPSEIVIYINEHLEVENSLKPVNRPYSKGHDDQLRLVSACALGHPCTTVGSIWTPRVNPQTVLKTLQEKTGRSITPLRHEVYTIILQEVVEKLTERIGRIGIQTATFLATTSSAKDAVTAGEILSQAALRQDSESLSELRTSFALGNLDPEHFLRTILVQSKESLFEILRGSPLVYLIGQQGAKKLETVQHSQQLGENLSSAGRKFNLTREAVRQHLEHIKSIHPLAKAILEATPSPPEERPLEISEPLIQSLREEIIYNPERALSRGLETSGIPSRQPYETDDTYLKRIFFEAFAGRYVDGQSTKQSFPAPLHALQPSPREFFRAIVYEYINHTMRESLGKYTPSVSPETLNALYDSDTTNVLPNDRSLTVTYLLELVSHPAEGAHDIWQRIAPEGISSKNGEKIKVLLEPLYRRLGKQRAASVCSVLSESWCSAWLPSKGLQDVIQVRIIEQNSVAETCEKLGITHGTFSMMWSRVTLMMPGLRKLTPRRIYSVESSRE